MRDEAGRLILAVHGSGRSPSPTTLSVPLLGAWCMSVAVCPSSAEMPQAHSAVRLFWVNMVAVYGGVISELAGSVRLRGFPALVLFPTFQYQWLLSSW